MALTNIFKKIFAQNGDQTLVNEDQQSDGTISIEEGYTINYELDQDENQNAKDIDRKDFNYLLNRLFGAIKEIQQLRNQPYNEQIDYIVGTLVYNNSDNKIYKCIQDKLGIEPPATDPNGLDNDQYWEVYYDVNQALQAVTNHETIWDHSRFITEDQIPASQKFFFYVTSTLVNNEYITQNTPITNPVQVITPAVSLNTNNTPIPFATFVTNALTEEVNIESELANFRLQAQTSETGGEVKVELVFEIYDASDQLVNSITTDRKDLLSEVANETQILSFNQITPLDFMAPIGYKLKIVCYGIKTGGGAETISAVINDNNTRGIIYDLSTLQPSVQADKIAVNLFAGNKIALGKVNNSSNANGNIIFPQTVLVDNVAEPVQDLSFAWVQVVSGTTTIIETENNYLDIAYVDEDGLRQTTSTPLDTGNFTGLISVIKIGNELITSLDFSKTGLEKRIELIENGNATTSSGLPVNSIITFNSDDSKPVRIEDNRDVMLRSGEQIEVNEMIGNAFPNAKSRFDKLSAEKFGVNTGENNSLPFVPRGSTSNGVNNFHITPDSTIKVYSLDNKDLINEFDPEQGTLNTLSWDFDDNKLIFIAGGSYFNIGIDGTGKLQIGNYISTQYGTPIKLNNKFYVIKCLSVNQFQIIETSSTTIGSGSENVLITLNVSEVVSTISIQQLSNIYYEQSNNLLYLTFNNRVTDRLRLYYFNFDGATISLIDGAVIVNATSHVYLSRNNLNLAVTAPVDNSIYTFGSGLPNQVLPTKKIGLPDPVNNNLGFPYYSKIGVAPNIKTFDFSNEITGLKSLALVGVDIVGANGANFYVYFITGDFVNSYSAGGVINAISNDTELDLIIALSSGVIKRVDLENNPISDYNTSISNIDSIKHYVNSDYILASNLISEWTNGANSNNDFDLVDIVAELGENILGFTYDGNWIYTVGQTKLARIDVNDLTQTNKVVDHGIVGAVDIDYVGSRLWIASSTSNKTESFTTELIKIL